VLLAPRHPIRHRAEIPSLETREALLSRSDQAGHLGKQTGREKLVRPMNRGRIPTPPTRPNTPAVTQFPITAFIGTWP